MIDTFTPFDPGDNDPALFTLGKIQERITTGDDGRHLHHLPSANEDIFFLVCVCKTFLPALRGVMELAEEGHAEREDRVYSEQDAYNDSTRQQRLDMDQARKLLKALGELNGSD